MNLKNRLIQEEFTVFYFCSDKFYDVKMFCFGDFHIYPVLVEIHRLLASDCSGILSNVCPCKYPRRVFYSLQVTSVSTMLPYCWNSFSLPHLITCAYLMGRRNFRIVYYNLQMKKVFFSPFSFFFLFSLRTLPWLCFTSLITEI